MATDEHRLRGVDWPRDDEREELRHEIDEAVLRDHDLPAHASGNWDTEQQ